MQQTIVAGILCRTCASGRVEWDHFSERGIIWCEKGLMGAPGCPNYSREPGSDDERVCWR
jgi:hypothetical protein